MPKKSVMPSMSWRREVFDSDPVRNIRVVSKSTSVVPTFIHNKKKIAYVEGGIEGTAIKLINFLFLNRYVSRFKEQPFCLLQIGGPTKGVPDFLVELSGSQTLHIIQCKAERFMTPDVVESLELEKLFLESKGFKYHSWRNQKVLTNDVYNNIRTYERGMGLPLENEVLLQIEQDAEQKIIFGELMQKYGPDNCQAALARGIYFVNLMEKIDEQTSISSTFSSKNYEHLFENRAVPRRWFESLES